jgi:hypothetical protein
MGIIRSNRSTAILQNVYLKLTTMCIEQQQRRINVGELITRRNNKEYGGLERRQRTVTRRNFETKEDRKTKKVSNVDI